MAHTARQVYYTNQSGSLGSGVLMKGTANSAGTYVVHVSGICRTATSLGDIDLVVPFVTFTCNGVARTITPVAADALSLVSTANAKGWSFPIRVDASTDISVGTTYTDVGVGTDGAYDMHWKLLNLGPELGF